MDQMEFRDLALEIAKVMFPSYGHEHRPLPTEDPKSFERWTRQIETLEVKILDQAWQIIQVLHDKGALNPNFGVHLERPHSSIG
jgi:hypothetical protein